MNPRKSYLKQWLCWFTVPRCAILAGILAFFLLFATRGRIGVTWDEPTYFLASEKYISWLGQLITNPVKALSREEIDSTWQLNHEHPPFDKVASGIVWVIARNFTDDLTAHRLFNILFFSLTTTLLFHLVAEEFGKTAGWMTVAALLCMPRFFFHAHLASLDIPATCMILIFTYIFWRTKDRPGWRATVCLGMVCGAAAGTRINTLMVMPILGCWILLFQRKMYLFLRLCFAGLIGGALFLLLWPWLYYHTLTRLHDFVWVVVSWPIPQYYLYGNYMPPPWYFAFGMLFMVIPLGIVALLLVGVFHTVVCRQNRPFACLLAANVLLPILLIASGWTKVYDNSRMLMPVFPFLATFAGIGFAWLRDGAVEMSDRLRISRYWAVSLTAAGILAVLLPPCMESIRLYPYLLSYYSEAVGGLPGAHRLGMETTYWSESYLDAVPFINAHARPGDTIWVLHSSVDVMVYYQLHGLLRKDVVFAGIDQSDTIYRVGVDFQQTDMDYTSATFVVVQHRESLLYDLSEKPTGILSWMEQHAPAFQMEREDIPILDIFWKE
jgi:4-amino-4-deoxy-L-arabinose transferase-like glycosyltransferase